MKPTVCLIIILSILALDTATAQQQRRLRNSVPHQTNQQELEEVIKIEDVAEEQEQQETKERSKTSKEIREERDLEYLHSGEGMGFMEHFDPSNMLKFRVAEKGEESFYVDV